MEYQVGSLADMISGSSFLKKEKKSKKSDISGTKVKFEKVTQVATKKNVERKRKKSDVGSPQKKRLRFSEPLESDPTEAVSKDVNIKTIENTEKIKHVLDPEEESRTIFVGNVPKTCKRSYLKGIFVKYGDVETVRFRSASVADPQTSKRVAVIKGELHPGRSNINAYVRFEEVKSARKALAANGMVIKDHTLRVDLASGIGHYDQKKCVFIGNLKFTAEEEDLRKMFQGCGNIVNVRVVRNKKSGMGVGIAFVNFDNSSSVELALKLHGEDLMGRPLRISRLKGKQEESSLKKEKKKEKALKPDSSNGQIVTEDDVKAVKGKGKKEKSSTNGSEFQGEKNDKKKLKKKKKDKGEIKKKIMQGKLGIIPKSKKVKSQPLKMHV